MSRSLTSQIKTITTKSDNVIRGGAWYLDFKKKSSKFWQDLEISDVYLTSLEILFLHGLFSLFLSLETFYQRVWGSDF